MIVAVITEAVMSSATKAAMTIVPSRGIEVRETEQRVEQIGKESGLAVLGEAWSRQTLT